MEQCRIAFAEGIDTIIATPHVLRDKWQNNSPGPLRSWAERLNERLHGEPLILLGSEYYVSHDVLQRIDSSDSVIRLAQSRYLLLEFPASVVPPTIEDLFYQLQLRKLVPIIAHPERNLVFQTKRELLRSVVRKGTKAQITSGSLSGAFGETARDVSLRWLDEELVHFIATDAHDTVRRAPRVTEVAEELTRRYGADRMNALTATNPRAVIENRELPYDPQPTTAPPPRRFLDVIRRKLSGGN